MLRLIEGWCRAWAAARPAAAGCVLLCTMLAPGAVQAQNSDGILVSNTGQPNSNSTTLSWYDRTGAFTTGSAPYVLTGVDLKIWSLSSGSSTPAASLHAALSGNFPGAKLGDLTLSPASTGATTLTYTTSGIDLAANTTYVVAFDGNNSSSNANMKRATTDDEDSGSLTGWSIASGSRWKTVTDSTWRRILSPFTIAFAVRGRLRDTTAPTVTSIGRQTPTTSPTNADSLTWRVVFSEAVENVTTGDFTVTGTTATVQSATAVSGETGTYDVVVSGGNLASLDGTVTLGFASAQDIEDAAGNALTGTAPTGTNDNSYVLDNTAPTVTSVKRQTPTASTTSADSLTWRVTFSEEVENVSGADFKVTGTGLGSPTVAATAVSGMTGVHDVTVSGGNLAALNGAVTLGFASGQDIADKAGNALSSTTPTGANENGYTLDNGPTVTSIKRQNPATSPTNADSLTWRVVFSEAVENVTTGDFTVTGTTATVQSATAVSGETGTYDVTVSGGNLAALNDTVTLGFASAQDIQDAEENDLDTSGTPSPNETSYALDNTAPEVKSIKLQDPATSLTNADSLTWRVVFSEEIANVRTNDFAVHTFAGEDVDRSESVRHLRKVSGETDPTWDFTLSGGGLPSSNGRIQLRIATTQQFTDLAGNRIKTRISGEVNNQYVLDNTAPTVAFSGVPEMSTAPFTATVTFSEAVSGFAQSDIKVGKVCSATLSSFTETTTGRVWTVLVTPTASGQVTLDVDANAATDAAGNGNRAAPRATSTCTAPDGIAVAVGEPVTEGTSATFTLTRKRPTTAALTVNVSLSETGDMVAAANEGAQTATFMAGNATTTVSVATQGDSVDEVDSTVTLTLVADSNDPATYTIKDPAPSAAVTVKDDDMRGVTVSANALILTEGGSPGSYTVVLTSEPTGSVTVTPSSGDTGAVTVSGALTFTATNWNTPQTVTVTAVNDADVTDESVTLSHAVTGADYGANNVTAAQVMVGVIDTSAPTVTSIERLNPASSTTSADSLTWRVTFSEEVENVSGADFTVTGTGLGSPTVAATAVSGMTGVHDVTVSGGSLAALNGTVTLGFASGQDIADEDGNTLSSTTPTGANENSYTLDNAAPTVTSIERLKPASSPTNADSLTWRVTFSEAVVNVDAADFRVDGGMTFSGDPIDIGSVRIAVEPVQGATGVHDVTASGGRIPGLLGLQLELLFTSGQDIRDEVGNALFATTPTGDNETYYVDNQQPSFGRFDVDGSGTAGFAGRPPGEIRLRWRASFTEAVENMDGADFTVSGSTATVTSVRRLGESLQYEIIVAGGDLGSVNGNVTIAFASTHDIADGAGNRLDTRPNRGQANRPTYRVDNTPPTVTISGLPDTLSQAVTVTMEFSERVSGFTIADITAVNATLSGFTETVSGTAWTVLVTPTAADGVRLDIPAGAARDVAGNGNYSQSTHRPAPAITVAAVDAPVTEGRAAAFTLTRTETVGALTVHYLLSETGDMVPDGIEGYGRAAFAPDSATATVSVPTTNDGRDESDSTVTLTLTTRVFPPEPVGYTLARPPPEASVTVRDDDAADLSPPGPPTWVDARPADGGIVLTWGEPADTGGGSVTAYEYRTRPAGTQEYTWAVDTATGWPSATVEMAKWSGIDWTTVSSRTLVGITGLTAGDDYFVQLRARTSGATPVSDALWGDGGTGGIVQIRAAAGDSSAGTGTLSVNVARNSGKTPLSAVVFGGGDWTSMEILRPPTSDTGHLFYWNVPRSGPFAVERRRLDAGELQFRPMQDYTGDGAHLLFTTDPDTTDKTHWKVLRFNVTSSGMQATAPSVSSVSLGAPPGGDNQWDAGEAVEAVLTFSEAVTVDTTNGTPGVTVKLGEDETEETAEYVSGSGTTALTFRYTLAADEGPYSEALLEGNSLALNGGTIRSAATQADADLAHNAAAQIALRGAVPDTKDAGPTAAFSNAPARHDGESAFPIELDFSGESGVTSYATVRDSLLEAAGGTVTRARRKTKGSNAGWVLTVRPDGAGAVTLTLPVRECGQANAVCIGGKPIVRAATATVEGPPFTASFDGAPAAHGGTAFTVNFRIAAEPAGLSYATVRDSLFAVTGGGIERARRLTRGSNRDWELTVAPDGYGPVTLTLNPTDDCGGAPGVCDAAGRMLAGPLSLTVEGPPTLSVADAEVEEAEGATLDFVVTLSRALGEAVTVNYATSDGTAAAGSDYTAAKGTLTFAPGETEKTAPVAVLDDVHDEGSETVAFTLSNPAPARVRLADAEATGTISNTDAMPQAWIARFGRTVAEQVLDAVESRTRAARTPGVEVSLAGERIGWRPGEDPGSQAGAGSGSGSPGSGSGAGGPDAPGGSETRTVSAGTLAPGAGRAWPAAGAHRHGAPRSESQSPGSLPGAGSAVLPGSAGTAGRAAGLADWLRDSADRNAGLRSRAVGNRELLFGSSFSLTAEAGGPGSGGGTVSVWGRGAVTNFDGREGEIAVDGEVASAMLGADWGRGQTLAGLIVGHSTGEGGYRAPAGGGTVSSTLTGLYPWGRYAVSERTEVWGAAGYGEGTLTLEPDGQDAIRTDMDLWMAAAGLRGTIVDGGTDGLTLAAKTDAMVVETSTDAVPGDLAASEATVTRLRLGLEASRPFLLGNGAVLTPSMEAGVRQDGGDAETGFGADIGGGVAWSDPKRGLNAEVRGRGLLTHESKGFRERGLSGSLGWNPGEDGRGPSLSLTQSFGGASSGGADALLQRGTMEGLAANHDGEGGDLRARRLEARFGYGLSAFGDGFTFTPEAGVGLSDTGRDYSLGWRLVRVERGGGLPGASLELSFEATRRESAANPGSGSGAGSPPEHRMGLRLTARF